MRYGADHLCFGCGYNLMMNGKRLTHGTLQFVLSFVGAITGLTGQRVGKKEWKVMINCSLHLSGMSARYIIGYLEKLYFCPISALCSKFYPRNINYIPVVKFFACLDLEQKS
jgi:hypothetical protein